MADRYQFTNWTEELFEGRFGGAPYIFASGESKDYDPDKHYMLLILSKQLADRELAKGAKGVLRTKEAGNDYGKAIDENGNLYKPTIEMRKELMRKAIGELADKAIPFPETQEPEAGATKETTENIAALQDQVKTLTEMVQGLTKALGETRPKDAPENSISGKPLESTGNTNLTRDVLMDMAKDRGIEVKEGISKDQLIQALA